MKIGAFTPGPQMEFIPDEIDCICKFEPIATAEHGSSCPQVQTQPNSLGVMLADVLTLRGMAWGIGYRHPSIGRSSREGF
jgi:hypothetical protein